MLLLLLNLKIKMSNKKNQNSDLKLLFVLIGFCVLLLFSSGIVSAVNTCTIESSADNCQGITGGKVVMKLSSSDNAHGELASLNNYANVLCCNFGGGDTTCDGSNKEFGFSSAIRLAVW